VLTGHPGESGIGIVIKDEHGKVIASQYGYIGKATNNVAEYTALAACLKLVETRMQPPRCPSDSELMVRQMNGQYKWRMQVWRKISANPKYLTKAPFQFIIMHVPREKNQEADELATAV